MKHWNTPYHGHTFTSGGKRFNACANAETLVYKQLQRNRLFQLFESEQFFVRHRTIIDARKYNRYFSERLVDLLV